MEVRQMPEQNADMQEYQRLAEKYRPLLVLFPEIEDHSQRSQYHHDVGNQPGLTGPKPGRPPIDRDYHPRDIRFVLDHALLPPRAKLRHKNMPGRKGMTPQESRDRLLDAMSGNEISHIDLVDRHGPRDVDKFWRVYAEALKKDENPEYQRKTYARIVRGDRWFKDYISIQYWLAYFFDDWANVHEMDWEMVSVILKITGPAEQPIACVFCAHIGAFRKYWKDVDKVGDDGKKDPGGLHPVAYIANGSHASYFSDYPSYFNVSAPYLKPGLRTLIRALGMARPFTDYVPGFEDGFKCFPEVDVIPEPGENGWSGDWRWLNFSGKWGSPVELGVFSRLIARIPVVRHLPLFFQRPIREAGPPGPNTRGTTWEQPFDWVNLECLDAPGNMAWVEAPPRKRTDYLV
jgi:hypothetical protein